ncbi:TPA: staphyloferrin B biosynthesis citrate synthase SbnG, partial [Staphylococcus aureus]|nr:staphyloferrin B biosynthesis citrate synthase SbnG [Staphylococcus aureus]
GLDMIVEGAADLSQSLGIPWQTRDDQVTSHVQHIFEVVNAHGKHFCALPREDEDIAKWQAQGVQTFILGDDRGKIYRHLSASLATSKQKGDDG